MKSKLLSVVVIALMCALCACCGSVPSNEAAPDRTEIINPSGTTLEERINVPNEYERSVCTRSGFAKFLRGYSMHADKSPVLLYNGKEKSNKSAHAAVFALPLAERDLQQCADSVIRFYAEYYWTNDEFDKINFRFTNGFAAEYSKWRSGYRIKVDKNKVSWIKSKSEDGSRECFEEYLQAVFIYAGTMSMESEAEPIDIDDATVGDVFLTGGSPGHVVMIVDMCENADGKKAFLLGQGYMPAQEFHVLKNPLHSDDPWYYEDELAYPLKTPEYTFSDGSLKRLCY